AWSETSWVLEDVIDKLRAFGGRVEELTPTGVVASFGVDLVDDPPRRAAHAAMVVHKGAARARCRGSRSVSTWLSCLSDAPRAGSTLTQMRSAPNGQSSISFYKPSRRTKRWRA